MIIAIVCPGRDTTKLEETLVTAGHAIEVWPAIADPTSIEVAVCWRHPHGVLNSFSGLKLIASLGAGVDHVLADNSLPPAVPITRFTDPELGFGISKYVTAAILNYNYNWAKYLKDQKYERWNPILQETNLKIGVFGMGKLGQTTANGLMGLGFSVVGYSRSKKHIEGMDCLFGDIEPFLKTIDVLVCLVPLTSETRTLMNKDFFDKCNLGTYLINVARGEIIDDSALVEAVNSGKLSGACLDVFSEEPLPPKHDFWNHPKITVTPHIASISSQKSFASQLLQNLDNLNNHTELTNLVDRERGY